MQGVVAIAVLRAGLGMLDAVVDLIPGVKVGFAGLQRDEETALPMEYYFKLPDLSGSVVLILEPMLATGGSLSWAVAKAKRSGARDITALCVVAAPEGVRRMYQDHPDVRIVAAALDRELNSHYYIQPGLGRHGRPPVRDALMARPDFEDAVLDVVHGLPEGAVATYGEVAAEAGFPGAARAVGNLLRRSAGLPWWRVVAAGGRLVPGDEEEQARRLRAEGVSFTASGRVAASALGGTR